MPGEMLTTVTTAIDQASAAGYEQRRAFLRLAEDLAQAAGCVRRGHGGSVTVAWEGFGLRGNEGTLHVSHLGARYSWPTPTYQGQSTFEAVAAALSRLHGRDDVWYVECLEAMLGEEAPRCP